MTTTLTTKHTHPMVFGRREAGCPRCAELAAGATPVRWTHQRRADRERQFTRALAAHDCRARRCGPICTFGDW